MALPRAVTSQREMTVAWRVTAQREMTVARAETEMKAPWIGTQVDEVT